MGGINIRKNNRKKLFILLLTLLFTFSGLSLDIISLGNTDQLQTNIAQAKSKSSSSKVLVVKEVLVVRKAHLIVQAVVDLNLVL